MRRKEKLQTPIPSVHLQRPECRGISTTSQHFRVSLTRARSAALLKRRSEIIRFHGWQSNVDSPDWHSPADTSELGGHGGCRVPSPCRPPRALPPPCTPQLGSRACQEPRGTRPRVTNALVPHSAILLLSPAVTARHTRSRAKACRCLHAHIRCSFETCSQTRRHHPRSSRRTGYLERVLSSLFFFRWQLPGSGVRPTSL